MEKYKILIYRCLKLFLGGIGANVIQVFMIPYIANSLSSAEYGKLEFILTVSAFLIPLLNNGVSLAIFRFSVDGDKNEKENLITISMIYAVFLLPLLILTLIISFYFYKGYFIEILYISLIIFFSYFLEVFRHFVRGLNDFVRYSYSLIIEVSLYFLFFYMLSKYQIKGILIAKLLSIIVTSIYIFIKGKIFLFIAKPSNIIVNLKKMFKYSWPLIPNSMMWWIMSSSDKIFIKYYHGFEKLGIYTIATKIPLVLSSITGMFILVYQSSAMEEFKNKNFESFYSNIFMLYKVVLFFIGNTFILISPVLIKNFFNVEYINAWKFIPLLVLATIFSSLSVYIGVNYILLKKNKFSLISNMIGALLNIVLNVYFVKKLSLSGAVITTLISYLLVFFLRLQNTNKVFKLKMNYMKFISEICIYLFYSFIAIKYDLFYLNVVLYILFNMILLILNRKIFETLLKNVKLKFEKVFG